MTDSPENDLPSSAGVLAAGAVVGGRYHVHHLLGRGGMGIVYAASHELTQRKVALKLVEGGADLPGQRERFLSEARTAAAVRHPNIVDILDMGMHRSAPYLVMELLEGSSLDAVLSDGRPISLEQCLAWLLPIIGALSTLHDTGIIHRDVKPSNIYLSQVHHAIVPKLLDFGLARLVSDARLTRSGVVIGTPYYMAPEHAAGGAVGPMADVWSMGVVLYECIAGALPYSSTDRSVVAAQVIAGHVRPLRQARPDVPLALAAAIDGALQRDLTARHPSMRALAQALVAGALASGITLPDQTDPVGLPDYRLWRDGSSPRMLAAELSPTHELPVMSDALPANSNGRRGKRWAAFILFALIASAALIYWGSRPSDPPRAAPARKPVVTPPVLPPQPSTSPLPSPDAAAPTTQPIAPRLRQDPSPTHGPATPRRRKKLRPPAAPAEVETEWK